MPDVLRWLVQARAEVQLLSSRAIRLLDVQGLLLWVLADGMNPNWCFVKVCDSPSSPICPCKLIRHPRQEFTIYLLHTLLLTMEYKPAQSTLYKQVSGLSLTADSIHKLHARACVIFL